MRQRLSQLFTLLCVVLTALGAYNVLGDHQEVEALAKKSTPACAPSCSMARLDRSPWAQEFQFATPQGKAISVRCTRAFFLLGEYSCQPH